MHARARALSIVAIDFRWVAVFFLAAAYIFAVRRLVRTVFFFLRRMPGALFRVEVSLMGALWAFEVEKSAKEGELLFGAVIERG